VLTQQVEGLLLIDRVTLHQDPFGPLGDGSPPERTLKRVVFGEALEREVHRALHLLEITRVRDGGEDAARRGVGAKKYTKRDAIPIHVRGEAGATEIASVDPVASLVPAKA
jgi:hypothetical protein